MVDRTIFKKHLETAKTRLAVLEGGLKKLDAARDQQINKIEDLKRDIRSLAQLAGESEDTALGLTDACKEVFRRTDIDLSPTEVKDRLGDFGFDIEDHKHILASISTTLRRLQLSGFIESVEASGVKRWRRTGAKLSKRRAEEYRQKRRRERDTQNDD